MLEKSVVALSQCYYSWEKCWGLKSKFMSTKAETVVWEVNSSHGCDVQNFTTLCSRLSRVGTFLEQSHKTV